MDQEQIPGVHQNRQVMKQIKNNTLRSPGKIVTQPFEKGTTNSNADKRISDQKGHAEQSQMPSGCQ